MKAWGSKIKLALRLLRASTVNTFQSETAYFGNNWGNLVSTVFYTIVQILFINVLYSRVTTFAGYDKNEMFFLLFVSQLGFYFHWAFGNINHKLLIEDVRRGTLDFLLILPVPALWYATFRKIPLLSILRDGVPNLIILGLLIDWAILPLTITSVIFAIIVFFLGQIAWEGFAFLLLLPVFWQGDSKQIYSLNYTLRDSENVPWEGYRPVFQFGLSVLIPTLLLAMIPVSVALGKSDGLLMFGFTFVIAFIFLSLKRRLWRSALQNYTSAS